MLPNRVVLQNIAVFATGEVSARLVAFIATALLTRRLGPDAFGILGFATAIVGYLALAVNSGLNEIGAREVARTPDDAPAIYAGVLSVRLALAVAAFVVLAIVAAVVPVAANVRIVILLSGLSFLSLATDPSWVYKGLERPVAAAGQVLAQVIYVAGVATLIHGPDDVGRVPLAQFGGELIAAVAFALPLLATRRLRAPWALGIRLLRGAAFLTAGRVLRMLIVSFGVVLLGFMVAGPDLGRYTAAYRFCFLLMAIAGSISVAYLPSFTRAAVQGPEALRSELSHSLRTSLLIGAPLVAGSMVTAAPLLRLLFGPAYEPGAPAFVLLLLSMGFFFVHGLLSNVFLVLHRTGLQTGLYCIAAGLNVLINILAIPRYGIIGAATANVVAEGTIAFLGFAAMRRLGVAPRLEPLIWPLAAAVFMAAVLLAIGSTLRLEVQIAAGALLYAAAVGTVQGVKRLAAA